MDKKEGSTDSSGKRVPAWGGGAHLGRTRFISIDRGDYVSVYL